MFGSRRKFRLDSLWKRQQQLRKAPCHPTGLNAASNGYSSLLVSLADVNMDSHLDVAVTDGGSNVQVLLGSAAGVLHAHCR